MTRSPPPMPILATLLAALLAILAGCGSAPPPPADQYHALEPDIRSRASYRTAPAILRIDRLAARGFMGGRRIVWRAAARPLEVRRYDTQLWHVPLPQALTDLLTEAVRAARLFARVVQPPDRVEADYLLGGEVIQYEHRPDARPPGVIAAIRLTLACARDPLKSRTWDYRGTEPVADRTAEAMAAAFNQVSARLLEDAVRDLAHPPPCRNAAPP